MSEVCLYMKRERAALSASMSFIDHIRELRRRLIFSTIVTLILAGAGFFFYETIISLFFTPFKGIESALKGDMLFVNSIFEGFVIKLKVSILAGVTAAIPIYLFHFIRFVFPGLLPKERRVVTLAIISGFILAVGGFFYCYYTFIPFSISFLVSKGFIPEDVGILLNYEKNIFYLFKFILAFIVLFQTPILLVILMMLNLVKRRFLLAKSRFFIVGIFLLSALLTPPDFISQIGLALPLVLLYFIAIGIAKIFNFGGNDV